MANNITKLQGLLFETIEALKDPQNPMDISIAKEITSASQVLVNLAKVESERLKVLGPQVKSSFLDSGIEERVIDPTETKQIPTDFPGLPDYLSEDYKVNGVTTHKLRG